MRQVKQAGQPRTRALSQSEHQAVSRHKQKQLVADRPVKGDSHACCSAHCHCHGHISEKTISYLLVSFVINLLLSVVEIIGGVVAGSVALIGDALHNTSDAFSILIAVIAFKIGRKKANETFTFGFKRAEIIGGFVNLILLIVSGIYLVGEGVTHLIHPEQIEGKLIIWISLLALLTDAVTAKLSHAGARHNTNMRMVFIHNLADALGSVGVILSGVCVVLWQIEWVDGVVALLIAAYMIYHAWVDLPNVIGVLMNAAPQGMDVSAIKKALKQLPNVQDVHHIHIWRVNESDVSLECHMITSDNRVVARAALLLAEKFKITHCTIQTEESCSCRSCEL